MPLVKNATTAKLEALEAANASGHNANFSENYVADARAVYAAEYELMREVARAQHEGIMEVTIRTRTRTLTLPISRGIGLDLAVAVQEEMGDHLQQLEVKILSQLVEAESEKDDTDGTSDRAQVFALCMPPAAATMVPMHTPAPRFRGARQLETAA
jgi:DNA-binding protein